MDLRKAELKRDPGDLVLTGRGTLAQELKRDPKDILLRKNRKVKPNKKAPPGQGGRFAYPTQNKGLSPGLAAAIGRKKFGASPFARMGKK